MDNKFSRTKLLLGQDGLEKLKNSTVAIFGIGGVGSYATEGLARSGIGNFVLIDNDTICESNINRQIHANVNTVGNYKVDEMKKRILSINPDANIETFPVFYNNDTSSTLINTDYDYIIDAIDSIPEKIDLIAKAKANNINIISSMGAGNKLDPTKFEVADIYKTSVCPLARKLRKELKNRNITSLKTVYSTELPRKLHLDNTNDIKKIVPGSVAFVPSVVGMIIASQVVKDLIGI